MIIKNFKSIALTKSRGDALEIINSGLGSVLTEPSMKKQIHLSKNILQIQKRRWNLSKYKRVFVVGAGKASADMAEAIEKILGKRITKGLVIDTRKKSLQRIKIIKGTHPLPSGTNIKATKEIIKILKESGESDLIINLISGGGSALLAAPRTSLGRQIEINKLLLKRGASIQEINTIRKHISNIKGGHFSEIAGKSEVITLIISDVITNDLDVIASGPSVRDKTTIADAERIRKKYKLPSLPFSETLKKNPMNTTNILLVTNVPAAEAMKAKARKLGYNAKILTTELKGEARDVGKKLAQMAKPKTALIAAGETTVIVKGKGIGGRNQELALSASRFLKKGVVASCSTDGVDFIKKAGGGIVDEKTKEKAKKLGLNPDKFLNNNDSYNFLKKVNGIIQTGKTGTNVGDLMVVVG